jgi:hypothetical protein
LAGEKNLGVIVPLEQCRLSLLWVSTDGVVGTIAWKGGSIEVMSCSEQVNIGEFDQACVAMAAAAESGVDCCCVADALVVCEFKTFISRFADDGVQDLEHKSGSEPWLS